MTKEKERILDEIKVRQKQIAQIQSEIPKLWDQYYKLNEHERPDNSREA
jgi:hypothetical protein